MSRIAETFTKLKEEDSAAFMPYLVAGDPDLATTLELLKGVSAAGADLIELGVPFSDPMADGPTNQLAAERALKSGTTMPKILDLVKEFRKTSQTPIMLMGYYNPFFHYGLDKFCKDAAEAGVDGLIIPDLQPDDAGELKPHAIPNGIDPVYLIAPTSTPERLALVAKESRGFVYAVSLTGVTGARSKLPPELNDFIDTARISIDLPLCVGFGIGDPTMAREVAKFADGVIVGSAVVKRIAQAAEEGKSPVESVSVFVREMADATHNARKG